MRFLPIGSDWKLAFILWQVFFTRTGTTWLEKLPRQFRPWHDGRLHRLHRHRVRNRAADAFLRERIQRLRLEPGIFVARAVEHIDAQRQIVAGESPRAQDVEVLGADAMP